MTDIANRPEVEDVVFRSGRSASAAPRGGSSLRERLIGPDRALPLMSLGVGAVAWEYFSRTADLPFFPPLSAIAVRMFELLTTGEILGHLALSLQNLAIGLFVSLGGGLLLGLLMGLYRRFDMALELYVRGMLTVPALVFAPVLFAIFGLSRITIVILIVLYAAFVMVMSTAGAVKSVQKDLIEMARSYGANDVFVFRRVVIPAATPLIMAGVRLSSGRAVKGMINGEMFIHVTGLGGVLMAAGRAFDSTTVLAIMGVIILVAIIVLMVVGKVDRRLTEWLPESAKA